MMEDIRQNFMVDVSQGPCERAKQYALYEHEGGLLNIMGNYGNTDNPF